MLAIKDFEKYLLFYLGCEESVDVIRVARGAAYRKPCNSEAVPFLVAVSQDSSSQQMLFMPHRKTPCSRQFHAPCGVKRHAA
jgi:hypothetical protein